MCSGLRDTSTDEISQHVVMDRIHSGIITSLPSFPELPHVETVLQYSLILLLGIVTGRMFGLGHFKVRYFIASVVLVVVTLVAECKEYWQFLLRQGFASGVSPYLNTYIFPAHTMFHL